jgi:HPt (histidine-containing phosphotransfer) domain-containing protein
MKRKLYSIVERLKNTALRELPAVILIPALAFLLTFIIPWKDLFARAIYSYSIRLAGELIITAMVFVVCALVYIIRVVFLKNQGKTFNKTREVPVVEPKSINENNKYRMMGALQRYHQHESPVKEGAGKAMTGKPKVNLQRLFNDPARDQEERENILSLFKEDALRLLKEIELAVKAGRMTETSLFLHTLRGQCGLVEMDAVDEIAQEAEVLAANNQLSKVEQMLPKLSREVRESLSECI